MSYMGVDVGTTGVKAVVFNENGQVLSQAYEEYNLLFPFAGAAELDSAQVVASARRVIAKAASEVKNTNPVRGIGIASQGEAFTPLGSDGAVLANIMTSSDSRAQSFVDQWNTDFGLEKLYHITGHTSYPMYSLFKLSWLKENRREIWDAAWKYAFCQDLVAHSLTGRVATEHSMAARSMLFDVAERQWSPEICNYLGLDPIKLPDILQSGETLGIVNSKSAAELGLGADVKVAVCGHDQPVGALGCGSAVPGSAAYSIGTVECITPMMDRFVLSDSLMESNLASYPHVLAGMYTTVAFHVTGGSVLKWFRDNLGAEEARLAKESGEDVYNTIIAEASEQPSNLILLSQFGPTGTPHFDPLGTGALFGLNLSTTRGEVIRAFLEGITLEMKWNLSILAQSDLRVSDLRVIGGGARSETWMQIKSDILGVPLTRMAVTEATCMGAAMLAAQGMGEIDCATAQREWAREDRRFEPRAGNIALYEDRFGIYKELYNSLGRAREMLAATKGGNR